MSLEMLLAQFDGLIQTPSDVAQLNETILDWAVRGKLTPQDPNDEPASELLKRIVAEKARLVDEGKIRAEKPLPPVREEDVPYEVPAGWVWARLGQVLEFAYGNGLPQKKRDSIGRIPVYGSNGQVGYHSESMIDDPCIVVGRKGSSGAVNLVLEPSWVIDTAFYIVPPDGFDLKYLFYLLKSLNLEGLGKGIKPGLNRNEAYQAIIGLPPQEEQKRIVAKVEELFAQTERLAGQLAAAEGARRRLHTAAAQRLTAPTREKDGARAAWELLAEQFDALYTAPETIEALKQAILQLAVQGRLVRQDPHDEPASELLKRIAAEKARLVEEGKIRAEKPLPPVREKDVPYEVPAGWVWVRLGYLLIDIRAGKSFGANKYPAQKGELGVLKVSAVTWGRFQPEENKALFSGTKIEGIATVQANDVLISRANTSQLLGAVVLVDRDYPNLILSDKTLRLDFVADSIHKPFMVFALRAKWVRDLFEEEAIGTSSSMRNISQQKIRFAPIALPPYSEQKRIVEKLKNLFALCDCLAEQVTAAEGAREQLLAAVLTGVSEE